MTSRTVVFNLIVQLNNYFSRWLGALSEPTWCHAEMTCPVVSCRVHLRFPRCRATLGEDGACQHSVYSPWLNYFFFSFFLFFFFIFLKSNSTLISLYFLLGVLFGRKGLFFTIFQQAFNNLSKLSSSSPNSEMSIFFF